MVTQQFYDTAEDFTSTDGRNGALPSDLADGDRAYLTALRDQLRSESPELREGLTNKVLFTALTLADKLTLQANDYLLLITDRSDDPATGAHTLRVRCPVCGGELVATARDGDTTSSLRCSAGCALVAALTARYDALYRDLRHPFGGNPTCGSRRALADTLLTALLDDSADTTSPKVAPDDPRELLDWLLALTPARQRTKVFDLADPRFACDGYSLRCPVCKTKELFAGYYPYKETPDTHIYCSHCEEVLHRATRERLPSISPADSFSAARVASGRNAIAAFEALARKRAGVGPTGNNAGMGADPFALLLDDDAADGGDGAAWDAAFALLLEGGAA